MSREALTLGDRAHAILGSRQLAMQWLNSANRLLDGQSPASAVTTPEGRRKVERQLAWFAGRRPMSTPATPERLQDLVSDPMIQLVLERAGSGPEELLRLYRQPGGVRTAA